MAASHRPPCFSFPLPLQVLTEVGMDAGQADELLAAAAGGDGAGSTASAPSEEGSPTTGGASSRSVSYEDFRRMLLSQPPSMVTKVCECKHRATGSRAVLLYCCCCFGVWAQTGSWSPEQLVLTPAQLVAACCPPAAGS
jgi:hypothetical protein